DRAGNLRDENQPILIPLDYHKINRKRYQRRFNLTLEEGDVLHVPKIRNTILVFGNVERSSEIPFRTVKGLKYYIKSTGGFKERPDRKKVYVIKTNGIIKTTKNFLFIRLYPRIKPGYEIIVPVKPKEIEKEK